jgi:sec-independent protein translocase protein TatC
MNNTSKKGSKSKHNKMSFLDHLEVLRWIFMRIVIVLFVIACFVYLYREFVFHEIVMASKDMDFWTYTKFCNISHQLNSIWPNFIEADVMCFDTINPDFLPGKVTGKFVTAMLVAMIGAFIISFPYILWEFWRFLKPALYPKEKKSARGLVFFSSLLFLGGILFGYYIINPLSVHFLIGFDMGYETLNHFPMNSFMAIVASTTLAAGVMFELPILIYFLSKAGLVTPDVMKKYRKHSFVATLILAAIITPPDVISQITVAIPIVVLYELSIFISRWVNKRRVI